MSQPLFYTDALDGGRTVKLRRPRRRRSEARTLVSLCLAFTAWSVSADMAGRPDPDQMPAINPLHANLQRAMAAAGGTQPTQTAIRSAEAIRTFNELIFGAPTRLATFAPPDAMRAPILQSALLSVPETARTLPVQQYASVPFPVPDTDVEIPLPPTNPFRNQPSEKTVVARVTPVPLSRPASEPKIVAKVAAPEEKGFFQKLFGGAAQPNGPALAYARTEEEGLSTPGASAPLRRSVGGEQTAIYDIEAHVVILPNGKRLEAHSGLGDRLDDPRSMREKNRGVTPPNVYELELRKDLFHGVRAIRLKPVDEGKMFGRDGILAHTFMLGPRGDSNGCVSFRDYDEFLKAYLRGEVTRMVVVTNASSLIAQNTARSGT